MCTLMKFFNFVISDASLYLLISNSYFIPILLLSPLEL